MRKKNTEGKEHRGEVETQGGREENKYREVGGNEGERGGTQRGEWEKKNTKGEETKKNTREGEEHRGGRKNTKR